MVVKTSLMTRRQKGQYIQLFQQKERRNTLAFSEQVTEHLSLRGTWLFLGSVRMMRQQARVTRSPTSFHTADKQILGDAFAPASSGWAGWIEAVSLQLREAMSARCRTLM